MSACCNNEKQKTMILSCSGASNVGQLTNQAAVELTMEGKGRMFCLAGVGGQLSGFVQSAKDTQNMIAVDGCPVGCAKAILEKNQVPLARYLVVTELGIEKNHDFNLERPDIDRVKEAIIRSADKSHPTASPNSESVDSPCCCS